MSDMIDMGDVSDVTRRVTMGNTSLGFRLLGGHSLVLGVLPSDWITCLA